MGCGHSGGARLGLTLKQTMVMIEPLEGAYFSWIAGVEAGLAARAKRT